MIRAATPITGRIASASARPAHVAGPGAPAAGRHATVPDRVPAALRGAAAPSALSHGFTVVLQALGEACAMAGLAPAPRERR